MLFTNNNEVVLTGRRCVKYCLLNERVFAQYIDTCNEANANSAHIQNSPILLSIITQASSSNFQANIGEAWIPKR